jgi:hypothetical protein
MGMHAHSQAKGGDSGAGVNYIIFMVDPNNPHTTRPFVDDKVIKGMRYALGYTPNVLLAVMVTFAALLQLLPPETLQRGPPHPPTLLDTVREWLEKAGTWMLSQNVPDFEELLRAGGQYRALDDTAYTTIEQTIKIAQGLCNSDASKAGSVTKRAAHCLHAVLEKLKNNVIVPAAAWSIDTTGDTAAAGAALDDDDTNMHDADY